MEAPELADMSREDAERTAAKERRAGAAATTVGAGTADCAYLVFAEGAEAARLCHPFANAGSVVLHDVAMAGNAVHPTATDRAVYVFRDEATKSVLVACQHEKLTSAQCDAVVRAAFGACATAPKRTLVLTTTMDANMRVRSSPPAGAYFVETDADVGAPSPDDVPPLPPGNIVGGAAAAALTYCHARGWPARLFVAVTQTGGGLADATGGDEAAKLAAALRACTCGALGGALAPAGPPTRASSAGTLYA